MYIITAPFLSIWGWRFCVPSSISTEPRPVWWEGGALFHGVCHCTDLKVFFLSSFLPISHMRRTIDFGWMLVFYSHIFQPSWNFIYLKGMWIISLFYKERVEQKKKKENLNSCIFPITNSRASEGWLKLPNVRFIFFNDYYLLQEKVQVYG